MKETAAAIHAQQAAATQGALQGPHFNVAVEAAPRVATRLMVILPIYNEATLVGRSLETVVAYASEHPEYRFVFVDDGSTDGTADLLRERLAALDHPGVSLLALPENVGKGGAIKAALALADGEHVCFTDGDLAYPLTHLPVLEQALQSHDLAIGFRPRARHNLDSRGLVVSRAVLGWMFNRLVRLSLGLPFRDTQAGLKGFRAPVAEHLFRVQRVPRFGFDAELLFLARKFGYRVAEFPAQVSAEHSYKTAKIPLIRNAVRMFGEVVEVRRNDRAGRYL